MARQTLDNARAAFKTRDGAPGTSGVSADRLAFTAAAVASGDDSAVRQLASMLVSADGVTVYEMEEARLATALLHYLVGDGAATTEPSTLATRRDAFRIAFLEPATPPRIDESRRGEREDKANAAIGGVPNAPRSPCCSGSSTPPWNSTSNCRCSATSRSGTDRRRMRTGPAVHSGRSRVSTPLLSWRLA